MPFGSYKNQHFGGTYHLHHQGKRISEIETALVVTRTSVPTRATRGHIPGGDIFHSHRCENFKSYIVLTGLIL
jgi:hypothetical protein